SNGTGATSVERYVVTPSINVDGANDNASHRIRVLAVIGSASRASSWCTTSDAAEDRRRTQTAHAVRSAATTTYPIFQNAVCCPRGIAGSNRIGNASSAAKLPTLLAEYSQ